jgi:dTDP-4-dehydrorhamnose 3,5-epimerase
MLFVETKLAGVFILEPERKEDERGFFARTFCEDEFSRHGLVTRFVQNSASFNLRKGTLRGLHWQAEPLAETKIVRCTRGAIFDVAVDVRPTSVSFGRWISADLTQANGHGLYIPAGFAHGFQTLIDETQVEYQISTRHSPESARGARWDDAQIRIDWPLPNPIMNTRDRAFDTLHNEVRK